MNFPFGDTMTLHTRTVTGADTYGNDTYGSTDTTVVGAFAPAGSQVLMQGQLTVLDQDTAYLPGGTNVETVDKITVRGTTYLVDGSPFDYIHPGTGWNPGVVVKLLAVTG